MKSFISLLAIALLATAVAAENMVSNTCVGCTIMVSKNFESHQTLNLHMHKKQTGQQAKEPEISGNDSAGSIKGSFTMANKDSFNTTSFVGSVIYYDNEATIKVDSIKGSFTMANKDSFNTTSFVG